MPAPCSGHACSLSCNPHMLPFSGECDILQDGSSTTGPLPPPVGIRSRASLPEAQLQLLTTSGVHWGTEEALQLSESYLLSIYPRCCCCEDRGGLWRTRCGRGLYVCLCVCVRVCVCVCVYVCLYEVVLDGCWSIGSKFRFFTSEVLHT